MMVVVAVHNYSRQTSGLGSCQYCLRAITHALLPRNKTQLSSSFTVHLNNMGRYQEVGSKNGYTKWGGGAVTVKRTHGEKPLSRTPSVMTTKKQWIPILQLLARAHVRREQKADSGIDHDS